MFATASCPFPLLERWKGICEKNFFCALVDSVLSGFAQIAFNDNTFSGLLMVIATWAAYPVQAISGLWATLAATLTACLIGVPKGLIRSGLYGFNAALVGVAVPVVAFPGQGVTLPLLLYSAVGGIMTVYLAAALGSFFAKWNVPALSFSYCVTISLLAAAGVLIGTMGVSRAAPAVMELTGAQAGWSFREFVTASLAGVGQVLWVEKPISGVLYIVAILFASRIDALSTVVGTVIGTAVAIALGLPKDTILLGLYGYNAVLLMKVITRGFKLSVRSYLLALLAAGATTLVGAGLKVILAPIGVGTFAAWPYATICAATFLGRDKFSHLKYVPAKYWGVPETISQGIKAGEIKAE